MRVVELGPLKPERVYVPSIAPVVEFLPGDRVRAQVVVVDSEGLPLADDELDSVWLQCGTRTCRTSAIDSDEVFDPVSDEAIQVYVE